MSRFLFSGRTPTAADFIDCAIFIGLVAWVLYCYLGGN